MLGFKSTHTAAVTLSGTEMVHMMRKRQALYAFIRSHLSPSSSKSSLPYEVATTLANSLTGQDFATEPLKLAAFAVRGGALWFGSTSRPIGAARAPSRRGHARERAISAGWGADG